MRFYDRKKELEVLEQAAKQQSSAMIIVSGRRRVGKSRLVDEFLKKSEGVKILIVPKEEKQVAADFADAYYPVYLIAKGPPSFWIQPHVDYNDKDCTITFQDGKTKKIKLPLKDGWYEQDKFGLPTGKPSSEDNPNARYLRRRQGTHSTAAVRHLYAPRVVDLSVDPSERLSVLGVKEGHKPKFDTVKEALEYFFTSSKERILYIDEFPNFLEVNPAIPYELQSIWENYKDKTDKILIFSGSYVSMMDKIFTRQKAPLFNRATFKIILQPLPPEVVWEMQADMGVQNPIQKITNYCIFGGIPYYYEVLERYGIKNNTERLFFDIGQLKEEGQDILRQEFGSAYKKYFSILEAIGSGLVSAGEIAQKVGIESTTLSKYIQSLQNDFKLIERRVPFDQNPSRSKKGIYAIKDNMLAFWFSHVYGKVQPLQGGELNEFVSKRFENLCSEFLQGHLDKKGERILKVGRWWGSVEVEKGRYEQREIDLIIETDKAVYLGECKWSNHKIGENELRRLQESSKGLKVKKPIVWVLFSKSGFSISGNKDILLFDAPALTNA